MGFTDPLGFYDKSGLVQLWSLTNRKAPEYQISCQTEIVCSMFHIFKKNIIICGTSTGQILQYDTRQKPIPFSSTPLDLGMNSKPSEEYKSHSFPLSCVLMTGTEISPNILSLSGDGVLCTWSTSNMMKPMSRIELLNNEYRSHEEKEVLVLSKSLSQNHPKKMLIGSEDGNAYEISTSENDEKENILKIFKAHKGPINSIEYHPFVQDNENDFSDLFITSSSDWTNKLWSVTEDESLLCSFDVNDDCIYCSKWHPTNPSVFVTGDGCGKIHFWDLNRDRDVPTYEISLSEAKVVSKLAWNEDGKKLAAGRDDGKITIYGAGKDLLNVKNEDLTKFKHVISDIKRNRILK